MIKTPKYVRVILINNFLYRYKLINNLEKREPVKKIGYKSIYNCNINNNNKYWLKS